MAGTAAPGDRGLQGTRHLEGFPRPNPARGEDSTERACLPSHQPWLCPVALRGPVCLRCGVSELGSAHTRARAPRPRLAASLSTAAAGPLVPGLAGLQLAAALAVW